MKDNRKTTKKGDQAQACVRVEIPIYFHNQPSSFKEKPSDHSPFTILPCPIHIFEFHGRIFIDRRESNSRVLTNATYITKELSSHKVVHIPHHPTAISPIHLEQPKQQQKIQTCHKSYSRISCLHHRRLSIHIRGRSRTRVPSTCLHHALELHDNVSRNPFPQ